MNKAALLADMATLYKVVGIPEVLEPPVLGVTPYIVNVMEVGFSEGSKKPTAYRKNIQFYVYNEGLGDESAYYARTEPKNDSNTDVSCALADVGLFSSYEKIYNSTDIRKRIVGWLIKAAATVMDEAGTVGNHSMRLKWAYDVVKDPSKYVNICMTLIAQSDDVKVLGAACSDADLAWLSYMITQIATVYGFTN